MARNLMARILAAVTLMLFVALPCRAAVWVVEPGQLGGIQAVLSNPLVVDGDVIELEDGTYTGSDNRDLDFLGKKVTLCSQSGDPTLCIIDCEEQGRGISFDDPDEDNDTIVRGITIRNGIAWGSS